MISKYLLPLAAACALTFAVYHVVQAQRPVKPAPPAIKPPESPFATPLAGSGIIEARTENIAIGSPTPGIVQRVHAKVRQKVRQGELLFELDNRQMLAELAYRQANLDAAKAQLAKLENLPRPEEIPTVQAKVDEAEAHLAEQQDQYKRAKQLFEKKLIVESELIRWQQTVAVAAHQLTRAKADLGLLKAGSWEFDKAIARASIAQVAAQVQQTQIELERLRVAAPLDGEVLQCNVRPGEFVGTPPGQALIVLGDVDHLHVRVDIDEHDIPRFRRQANARCSVRGMPQQFLDLTFVREEPYVIPKRSLTGDNTERVDTRVLQVLYALQPTDRPLYVGQQVDVYIDAAVEAEKQ